MRAFLFSTGHIEAPGLVMRHRGTHCFPMVCALLDHPRHGLTLIDAGFGQSQLLRGAQPPDRLLRHFVSINLHASQIARAHIARLGYDPDDVQRIIMTHLHWDHADAIADFPSAEVLVDARELQYARGLLAQGYSVFQFFDARIRPLTLKGPPNLGFERSLDLFDDGSVILLDLPGHSAGHIGVWLPTLPRPALFTGDAYFEADELDTVRFRPYQWINTHSLRQRHRTLERLHALRLARPEVELLSCHADTPPGGWTNRIRALHDPA